MRIIAWIKAKWKWLTGLFIISTALAATNALTPPAAPSADKPAVQLLLISDKTARAGISSTGDLVGIFPGDHVFSPAERDGFLIVRVEGVTVKEAQDFISSKLPDITGLSREQIDALYTNPKYKVRAQTPSATRFTLQDQITSNVTTK